MHAILASDYGDPKVMSRTEPPDPVLRPGEAPGRDIAEGHVFTARRWPYGLPSMLECQHGESSGIIGICSWDALLGSLIARRPR
jgi:hypothetical protein